MSFALNLPLNSLSFGQTSVAILREIHKRGLTPAIFPIGPVDLSSQNQDAEFNTWLTNSLNMANQRHSRKDPAIRLWHIMGSLESYSATYSRLITFQETGQLTPTEVNILRNQNKVYVTNKYTQTVFGLYGIQSTHLPLGFDSHNFHVLEKRPSIDGATSWLMVGKAEHRKHTYRQIALWAKKYGNKKEHRLNLAVSNSFLPKEHQDALIAQALEGKQYWNINRLEFSPTNAEYNDVLQSSEIVLCCSGSEGFGLPEFHATALGAWPVALRAHAYLDYFNDANAVLVNPSGMEPIYDGIFFQQGAAINQGNRFTFADEDWYAACEEAERRVKSLGINRIGMELQKQTYAQTVDILLSDVQG